MVFGHRFDFKSEPVLQKEFLSFPSDPSLYPENPTIQVIASSKPSLLDDFPLKTDWVDMSGQKARYHSMHPFGKADGEFTWALEIKEVVALIWEGSDKKIIYRKGKNYTPERLRFWIYHTFFPLVLELERKYRILHVGAVEIKGKPVLFSAFSFGGKSTLTDYFIQKGHTMLSDDSMAINKRGDRYYAIASYPFHRPYRELEALGYPVKNFATEPKPLHAVYLLKKCEPDAIVEINELKGIEKFKAFHYSTFIDFSFMKKERFDFFTQMSKHIPVYQVSIPWDLKRLDEVYETIVSYNEVTENS
ncbi:hypothetical protein [Sulfurovum sp. TSL1]|uniref:hypothetical protein n=1 Tax=Sulfurovum sp. TSL1 TaxID=2826994 RepID=UPI001CC59E55|nr:hypothetical protein [Sulfurovum sp. TSL1]GIT98598.1 hypothetical protein TSL1_14190 [Sulfurovum sp. TSL1]